MPVPPVRGGLVEVGEDDGPCGGLHHLQLEPHGGGFESSRGAGAEQDGAGGRGQAGGGLQGSVGDWRPTATQVPHFLITGGAAMVIAVTPRESRYPLPVVSATDPLQLFF